MTSKNIKNRNVFLELTDEAIRKLVKEKGKPKVGVFVADGNRRLVLSGKRSEPSSETFYLEYARFFVDALKESINIFFNHGLETLFFPLFGPSLLARKNGFQTITIPYVYREVFKSPEWRQFYRQEGIRVKAYGDLSRMDEIDKLQLNMKEGIEECVRQTSGNGERSIFFGFMADMSLEGSIPARIINLYNEKKRIPSYEEIVEDYYGEAVAGADFVLFSNKLSLGSLPPLISTAGTRLYYFPAPGFLAMSAKSYRDILFDLLFHQPEATTGEFSTHRNGELDSLEAFYKIHKSSIIGTGQKIGEFWLPNLTTIHPGELHG